MTLYGFTVRKNAIENAMFSVSLIVETIEFLSKIKSYPKFLNTTEDS
jgi:hypothetical protein